MKFITTLFAMLFASTVFAAAHADAQPTKEAKKEATKEAKIVLKKIDLLIFYFIYENDLYREHKYY